MALPRSARLRRSADVRRVLEQGKTSVSPLAVLYWLPARSDGDTVRNRPRIAIIASRRVGKAVVRNRWRRRVAEILRLRLDRLDHRYDLVVIVRTRAVGSTYARMEKELDALLRRARLYRRVNENGRAERDEWAKE